MDYVFEARTGQTMQILLEPSNRSCYFNLWEPGAAEAAHIARRAAISSARPSLSTGPTRRRSILCAVRRGGARLAATASRSRSPAHPAVSARACRPRDAGPLQGRGGVDARCRAAPIAAGDVKPDRSGFLIEATTDGGRGHQEPPLLFQERPVLRSYRRSDAGRQISRK